MKQIRPWANVKRLHRLMTDEDLDAVVARSAPCAQIRGTLRSRFLFSRSSFCYPEAEQNLFLSLSGLTIAHTGDRSHGTAAMAEDMIWYVSVMSSSR